MREMPLSLLIRKKEVFLAKQFCDQIEKILKKWAFKDLLFIHLLIAQATVSFCDGCANTKTYTQLQHSDVFFRPRAISYRPPFYRDGRTVVSETRRLSILQFALFIFKI
jgi:hypothetical protein